MKRGQVTIFIILAIILIILASVFFLVNQSKKQTTPTTIQPLQNFIQQCIDKTAKQAIVYTSERAGYYQIPENSLDNLTPYYFYQDKNLMPSKEEIQNQISNYINNNLNSCLNNFTNFQDFQIQKSEITTKTKIQKDKVSIEINFPLSISKDKQTYTLEKFDTQVTARLDTIYNAINTIIQEQVKNPEALNPHYVYQIATENNLNIKMIGFIENSIIFTITDKDSQINEQNLIFIFANKYTPISQI